MLFYSSLTLLASTSPSLSEEVKVDCEGSNGSYQPYNFWGISIILRKIINKSFKLPDPSAWKTARR